MYLHNLLNNLKKFWHKHWRGLILSGIATILFLIPQLFWGHLYQVGGDDTRLYYIFPWEFLRNFSFNIVSDNTLGIGSGYGPVSFFIPITSTILLIKILLPMLNTQFFMYGLNMSFGFYFFYLFLGRWEIGKDNNTFLAKIVFGIVYVLSIFNIKDLYTNQLLSIYLISVIPCMLYLYLKALQDGKWKLVLLASLIYSLFSSTILTLPWFIATVFSLLPVIIYLAVQYKKRFLVYGLLFAISIAALNIYWAIHYLISPFLTLHNVNLYASLNTNKFLENNDSAIRSLATLNIPLNQFLLYIKTSWSEPSTNLLNYLSGIIFFIIILIAGIVRKQSRIIHKEFLIALITLLWTFILFTPNMGEWSVALFIFLNHHMPLFSSLRNMYDKFSLSMAINLSLVTFISLAILIRRFNKIVGYILMIGVLAFVVVSSYSFVFPQQNGSTDFSTSISGNFNSDYLHLVTFFKNSKINGGRVLWLPLNQADYVAIEDEDNKNHFYFGPSPLRLLANVSDYTGFMGMINVYENDLGGNLLKFIQKKEYKKAGEILQKQNIKYIVTSNEKLPKAAKNFLYQGDMYQAQDRSFRSVILGQKVEDFGKRYSIYKINYNFENSTIYTTHDYNSIPLGNNVNYEKVNSYLYLLNLTIKNKQKLVFLDSYNKGWKLVLANSLKFLPFNHVIVKNYANGWELDSSYIVNNYPKSVYSKRKDGSITVSLILFFFPQVIAWLCYAISLFFGLFILLIQFRKK